MLIDIHATTRVECEACDELRGAIIKAHVAVKKCDACSMSYCGAAIKRADGVCVGCGTQL